MARPDTPDKIDHPRLWTWIYRVLVRAYPPAWRREFAADSERLFVDLHAATRRERGRLAAAWLALRVCAEVLPSALEARRIPRAPERERPMTAFLTDFRFAWRSVVRRPRHALIVAVTLAVGVATTTTAFSLLDAAVLRRLPFPEPEELVEVGHHVPERQLSINSLDPASFTAWRARTEVFERLEAVDTYSPVATFGETPDVLDGARVTPGLLTMLGARPRIGRLPAEQDADPGAAPIVLISESLWRSRLGADPDLQDLAVELDDVEHAVVGVVAESFAFPRAETQVWTPFDPVVSGSRARVYGRLREGLEVERAAELAAGIATGMAEADPRPLGWAVTLFPFESYRATDATRDNLWLAFGAAVLLLLVATVNTAHVVLARAVRRESELSIRSALGAGRGRLVRQVLFEASIVSVAGGLLGGVLSVWLVDLVATLAPQRLVRFDAVRLAVDLRAFGFALAAALLAGTVAGVVPAWRSVRSDPAARSRTRQRGVSASTGQRRLRSLLVTVEACAAVVLLAGAALLMNSFGRLADVDVGFDAERVVSVDLHLDESRYPEPALRRQFLDAVVARAESLPGVDAATATNAAAGTAGGFGVYDAFETRHGAVTERDSNIVPWGYVDPDYFDVVGIPLVAGRSFRPDEVGSAAVTISSALARDLWGDEEEAVGGRLREVGSEGWSTVVGVFEAPSAIDLVSEEDDYQIYYPLEPRANVAVVVRTEGEPSAVVPLLREAVWSVDPRQPIRDVRIVQDSVAEWLAAPRFYTVLMSTFAVLTVSLTVVGIFGVIGHAVSDRRQEIGIRTALGADGRSILLLIARGGVGPALVGLVVGVFVVLQAGTVLSALLYEVAPADPGTLALSVAIFLVATLVAAYVPARRALQIDPMQALRSE